jgi:hypothetical protein
LLYLLKGRLPYLGDIGLIYEEWHIFKSQIVEAEGPDSESSKDWDQVWTCLEQNRVGMALLHPSVASSVPIGLWPVVLARTTMKMSSPPAIEGEDNDDDDDDDDDDWDRDDNPVDGLFAVVRRLLMGGHFNNHNYKILRQQT